MTYVYGGAPYPPPGYAPSPYGSPYGAPPGAVPMGNDAYTQGYQQGANAVSPYAGQMNSAAGGISTATTGIFSIFTTLFSTIGNLLSTVVNLFSGLFGGAGGLFGGGAGQQAPGMYGPSAYYLQGVPAAPPPQPGGQPLDMNRALQVVMYKTGQVRSPQEAYKILKDHHQLAENYWIEAMKLCDQAEKKAQEALKMAQKVGGGLTPSQAAASSADVRRAREEAVTLMKRAEEYTQAVYNEALFTHLAYNVLVGPYGRFPNAGVGTMQKEVQQAWALWMGGAKPDLWDRVKLFFKGVDYGPAPQMYMQAYQKVDAILAQTDAAAA